MWELPLFFIDFKSVEPKSCKKFFLKKGEKNGKKWLYHTEIINLFAELEAESPSPNVHFLLKFQ